MDTDSKLLTAMLTPYGIYIYNVVAMKDLNGVLNIAMMFWYLATPMIHS